MAFVIDVLARRIVGRRLSRSMTTDFVLDTLEQALYARSPKHEEGLIHHSNRGVQYVSIRYAERLAEANIQPSIGSRGDSYDNALAKNERLVQNQTNPSPRPLENARSGRNRNL